MTLENVIRRTAALIICAAVCVGTAGCSKTDKKADETKESGPSARVTVDGTKFMVDGKQLWINGVNTPWINWNDFTGSMDTDAWEQTFTQLEADGVNCTRIWVNCAGENIVRLKTTGAIKNINENHWSDLDKLFEMAEKHKIYVMPTITSFDHCKGENGSGEKWRALLTSKENVDDFAEQYVKEFCKRYNDNEYIFAVDIMNEPDWVHENEECGQLEWDDLSYFFGKCAATIHENSDMLATVGMGIIKYNSANYEGNVIADDTLKKLTGDDNAYVDFYSTHYYMWQKPYFGFPFNVTPQEFGLDDTKPCLVGETSNDDSGECGYELTEKYEIAYENGWQGLMVWMERKEDGTWYEYGLTQAATSAFAEKHKDLVYPLGK